MKILITGANGYLGQSLSLESLRRGIEVCAAVRKLSKLPGFIEATNIGDINSTTDWSRALRECEVVVHLAARVHVNGKKESEDIEEFRKVNVEGTMNLAKQSSIVGIKRFIFISTIGVNGAETFGTPYKPQDTPAPHSAYALSKHEAERGLLKLAMETDMEVVIIRPPIIYGAKAPGNFGLLVDWLKRSIPLPLGCVKHNLRSFVAIDNIVDLILTCVMHPNAANKIFLVSDGEDISTAELLKKMGKTMQRPVYLLSVPVKLLILIASILGRKVMARSLLGSLQLDISDTCEVLNWKPSISMDEGLRRAVGGGL